MQQLQSSKSSINSKLGGSSAVAPSTSSADDAEQNWPGCFRHVARCRRLNKEEVVLILSDPLKFGLVRTEVLPAEGISSGTVYLCSKDRVRVLKHDGIDYVKRNAAQGSNRIREDVVKMKVNGRHAVNSYSSRGSGSACFWRRRYALEPPSISPSGAPRGRGGHQAVTWGDQLVHYLDDEEARGFARRSPFGAAGVARPLTSEECWRGRGAQLPPDGNIFQTASRRESRRDDHTAAATAAAVASVSATVSVATSSQAPAPSTEKPLPSIASTTVKLEAESFRGGGGVSAGGGWIGVTGKVAPGARANSGGSTSSTSASSSRYGGGAMTDTTGDNRAAVTAAVHNPMWGSSGGNENVYAMNGSGNGLGGDSPGIGAAMPSPAASRLGTGGGGSGGGGLSFWEAKKGMEAHHQQATPSSLNHAGFYDDIGALEFEGLGDVNGGVNGSHTDDDMNDLFRSFLVDGEDLLPAPSQGNHSGGTHTAPASADHTSPAGFGLRVSGSNGGGSGGGGGRLGGGYEGDAPLAPARRRANTSPECDDMPGNSTQGLRIVDVPFRPISPQQSLSHRSPMGMLPALVGSPPRREARPPPISSMNMHGNSGGRGRNTPSPSCFTSAHGSGGGNGNGISISAGAGGSECPRPGPLQLSSPWSQNFNSASGAVNMSAAAAAAAAAAYSSSPGVLHEAGGTYVPATLSPPGTASSGMSGGGEAATIIDFSPTWDFASGGAKLLICLAAPLDAEIGSPGPIVFFADRAVPSEVVSQTVVRCKVPPGPSIEGTGRVSIRVELSSHTNGGLRRTSSTGSAGFDSGSRGTARGGSAARNKGAIGVDVFEYRSELSSPSNSAPPISRGGTPRTPGGKRLTWQERPEDGTAVLVGGARKREWGEVTIGSGPLETVYSSPMAANWATDHRTRRGGTPRSSTPRGRETPAWGGNPRNGRGAAAAARRGSVGGAGGGGHGGPAWRRASADFGHNGVVIGNGVSPTAEDGPAYGVMPSDGREYKIRIVERLGERLGEISGSRGNIAASDQMPNETGNDDGTSDNTSTVGGLQGLLVGGGNGGGRGRGGVLSEIVQPAVTMSREESNTSMYSGSVSDSQDGGCSDLDDTALNELGDDELERMLEQMWLNVMGKLTDLESELNALDSRGYSVLHYTCLHNLGALVPVLLKRGANVNLKTGDDKNHTPLHLAAIGGSIGIVQELVRNKAVIGALDADGMTADKLATKSKKRDVALWLWAQSRSGPGVHPNNKSGPFSGIAPIRQDSPATPGPPRPEGVSPAGGGCPPSPCPPPSPWGAGAGEGWHAIGNSSNQPQSLLSLRPSLEGTPPHDQGSAAGGGFSPAFGGVCGDGGNGDTVAGGGAVDAASQAALPGSIVPGWGHNSLGTSGDNMQGVDSGMGCLEVDGDEGGTGDAGPWGLGIPPPGGGGDIGGHRNEDGEMSEAGIKGDEGEGEEEGGRSGEEGGSEISSERLLQNGFSNLSLHEKCALSQFVSQQQQQGAATGLDGAARDSAGGGVDAAELSGFSKVLAGGEEGGLREDDVRAIMSMMSSSDLNDLEDEVKSIQRDFRKWVYRCQYKSLRQASKTLDSSKAAQAAAKTLQHAWRERSKQRIGEEGSSLVDRPASLPRLSPLSSTPPAGANLDGSGVGGTGANNLGSDSAGGGPQPMDESGDAFGSARDMSGVESGSNAGGSVAPSQDGGVGGINAAGVSDVSAEERTIREERAAKSLQTAARLMLARKGRFQAIAKETRALLVIQRRSRSWLKKMQTDEGQDL